MQINQNSDIIMFMNNNKPNEFQRTTVYIPRSLHEQAKIMAVLTRTNLSTFMIHALSDKIKKIKEQPVGENEHQNNKRK